MRTWIASLVLASPLAAQGYVCAEGGGSPTSYGWGAAVFGWMLEHAPGGDVMILGVSGVDTKAASAFTDLGATSVSQLAVTSSNADDAGVAAQVEAADIVWLRGGDQWEYVQGWKDTATEDAIRAVFTRGGVIGGTSAGCAALSAVVYDARNGGVRPAEALRDPYDARMTFTRGFLDLVPGVVLDTHFTERGRIGRLPSMVARAWADENEDVIGVGVDDSTALCVHPDGTAEVLGEGAVTILHRAADARVRARAGEPPALSGYVLSSLTEGYVFHLATRAVVQRPGGATLHGAPSSRPDFDAATIEGNRLAHRERGDVWVDDGGDDLALFRGGLQLQNGTDRLRNTVISTRTWNNTDFDENRVGGVQYALRENPHWLGLLVDSGTRVVARVSGVLDVQTLGLPTSLVVIDAHGLESSAQSSYVASTQSSGPRQSVALEDARLHVVRPGDAYDARNHRVLSRSALPPGAASPPRGTTSSTPPRRKKP